MRIPITDIDKIGIIGDTSAHDLPLGAWSSGKNMRFIDGHAEKMKGHETSFIPQVDATFMMPVNTPSGYFWMYAGLTKAYVYGQSANTNITRMSGDYSQTARGWTGGVLNGIPVLNNGEDVPQMWVPPQPAQRLQALSNWPSTWRCKSLRPFKNYLVALNMTKAGVNNPYMVSWSHVADPGQVPDSWDITDATRDAGDVTLADTDGELVDQCEMQNVNFIYKGDAVYRMQHIGGIDIFAFPAVFKSGAGLLVPNAVQSFKRAGGGEHQLAFGPNDVYVHDGRTMQSVMRKRMRSWMYNNMDSQNYVNSFVVHNINMQEMWVCFPEQGNLRPNLALVWNYADDTTTIRDLPQAVYIASGRVIDVQGTSSDSWADAVGTWDGDSESWGFGRYAAAGQRLLMATHGVDRQMYVCDSGMKFNNTNMESFLERVGLSVLGKDFNGKPVYDSNQVKIVTEIWPRIKGDKGATVNIWVGSQDKEQDPITWQGPFPFRIGVDEKVDPYVTGKIISIRFHHNGPSYWQLSGYDLEVVGAGSY